MKLSNRVGLIFKLPWLAAAALLLSLTTTPAAATALTSSDGIHPDGFNLPGITQAGYPNFETDARVSWKKTGKSGYKLHVWQNGSYGSTLLNMNPTTEHAVTSSNYQLHAKFNSAGSLISGKVKINGGIPSMGIGNTLLMTANLMDFAFTDSLLGFNTTDIVCPVFDFCTENESVYVALAGGGFNLDIKKLDTTGLVVTTVPLPAASWLFGAGLLGLLGVARNRKTRH